MSKYIIDEMPLTVQPSLAKVFGLEKAIIIQQIHYALQMPQSGKSLEDGYHYIWNTYEQWQEHYFKWMSVESIRKWFNKLENEGILISIKPHATQWNHTKYYRLNYAQILEKTDTENLTTSKRTDLPHRSGTNDHIEADKLTTSSSQIIHTNNSSNINRPLQRKLSIDEVIELDTRLREKEQTFEGKQEDYPQSVLSYIETFPQHTLNPDQLKYIGEQLPDAVTDVVAWREVLNEWRISGWRRNNFVDMIKRYQKQIASKPKVQPNQVQTYTADIWAEKERRYFESLNQGGVALS